MSRSRRAWLVFATGAFLALAGVAAMSRVVLRLDREGGAARRQALVEENVRLSLWRMDAAFSLFVARESLRPYFEFRSLVPSERAWGDLFNPGSPNESLAPSPLLLTLPERVKLYFQVEPDGSVTSPEVPPESLEARAVRAGASPTAIDAARTRLESIRPVVRRIEVPQTISAQQVLVADAKDATDWSTSNASPAQSIRSRREYGSRMNLGQYYTPEPQEQAAPQVVGRTIEVPKNVLTPVWEHGDLFLVRTVTIGGSTFIQGCWLDWPAISSWLLHEVHDLLPNASLAAATGPQTTDERRLASLPADLVPGSVEVHDVAGGAPAVLVLIVAWLGVIIAIVASGALLRGALELSERRGAFVSAVTHELRTPLTTFRMYTEMLAEGMVGSAEQRQTYVLTLHREAERLTHLVENVLAYSRIEQGRQPATIEPIELSAFLDRTLPRLVERAVQGGMRLETKAPARDSVVVGADAAAIEQILFNLVDNACKYARAADDKRIELGITAKPGRVEFAVRDHGPGIAPDGLRRLFQPFSKSAAVAAETAPGIGLGLALCRQLARSRRGDLRYSTAAGGGAQFTLSLRGRSI